MKVYVTIYACGSMLGYIARDWEWMSYQHLLDAHWIRQVNTIGSATKSEKSNTAVYKATGLLGLVEMYQKEMTTYLGVIHGLLDELVELGSGEVSTYEDINAIKGKNDVYTWIRKQEKLVSEVSDQKVLGKYVP